MGFRKILVPVTGGARDAQALATAFAVAKPAGAHVTALFVHADPRESLPFGELPLSPEFVQDLIDTAADVEQAAATAARESLSSAASAAGVPLVGDDLPNDWGACATFAEATGYLPPVLGRAARLYDLVVFPPIRERDAHDMPDAFARVLVKTSAPVLLSALRSETVTLGRHIAIGWDDGISCARAMITAVPLLKQAEKITLLTVCDKQPAPADEGVAYLHLHKLKGEQTVVLRGGRRVAEALLSAAQDVGADLLVMGGYSRGRMTEAVFGGVSEHIVSYTTLPVFMVH